jgi:DNA-3-methyladenine glycosylase
VLIRAAEPIDPALTRSSRTDPRHLRGPGKLCRALAITRADNGLDLTVAESPLCVTDDPDALRPRVARSPRVGVDYAGSWASRPLRFFVPGHPSVSGPVSPRALMRRRLAFIDVDKDRPGE